MSRKCQRLKLVPVLLSNIKKKKKKRSKKGKFISTINKCLPQINGNNMRKITAIRMEFFLRGYRGRGGEIFIAS